MASRGIGTLLSSSATLLAIPERIVARIRDAPVQCLSGTGEIGADLTNPVAQGDHVVEPVSGEFAQMLAAQSGRVEIELLQHGDRVRVQGLRPAPGAESHQLPGSDIPGDHLGEL